MVGHISEEVVAAGFFIIKPSERKTSVGRCLKVATKSSIAGKTVVTHTVESGLRTCQKSGFFSNFAIAFCGVVVRKERLRFDMCPDVKCDRYNTSDLTELVKYDVKYHLVERPVFLDQYLCPAVTTTFIARRDDVIIGYGCVQPVVEENTFHLGPLFADDDDVAELLFNHIFNTIPNEGAILFSFPKQNKKVEDVLLQHAVKVRVKYFSMCRGKRLTFSLGNIYSMTETDASLI